MEAPGGSGERNAPVRISALLVSSADDPHWLPEGPFIEAGIGILRATGGDAALQVNARSRPDLVFLPVAVDGQSAKPLLDTMLAVRPQPVAVVIATNDQINAAAEAMRAGAFDCLFRPFSTHRLAKTLEAAVATLPAGRGPDAAPESVAITAGAPYRARASVRRAQEGESDSVIAVSPEMRAVLDHVDVVARSEAPVFLMGELGTGKDLVAHRLHGQSRRADGPFVTVDCATLKPRRIEDVLTGPDGVLARAAGGTLYFDELCELDPQVQPFVLQMIEASAPSARPGTAGPRFIAATGQDPHMAIRYGRLRSDLFYRLHVAPVLLPPLRLRRADIAPIARTKLAEFARAEARTFTGFSEDALALLERYAWPGNVRELLNVVWSVVVMHEGPQVTADQLPPEITRPAPRAAAIGQQGVEDLVGRTLEEIEQAVIEATIHAEGGSVPRAARVLDVSPSTLYRKREAWAKKSQA
jgi:DNA-binding NtrC family response regulator